MCGIAGLYRYGETSITEEQLALLLVGNEHRGNDATGMAFLQSDGSIQICKKDIPAWRFISCEEYKKSIDEYLKKDTVAVLLHTRNSTSTNPRDNNNNHPMYAGLSAVIHNGYIRNASDLFQKTNLERKSETDSDILRAVFDKYGFTDEAFTVLSKGNGSAAGAAIHPKYPNKLLLFRSGSPMELASTEDIFIFSSEKNTIHSAMRPFVKRFGIPFQIQKSNLAFSLMPDNTIWLLGPDGLEKHSEFKIQRGQYIEPIRKVYANYTERQQNFTLATKNNIPSIQGGRIDLGFCLKCNKEWAIPKGSNPTKYYCNKAKGGCGKSLVAINMEREIN